MKRTPDRDLIARARDIAERAELIHAQIRLNLSRVDEWTAGGTPSSGGEGTKGGDTSRPTETRAVRSLEKRDDPFERVRRLLEIGLKSIDGALCAYEATARRLAVMDAETARKLAEEEIQTGTACVNPQCARWITGLGEDRPRGGRCNSCREYKRVNGTERPHDLVHRNADPDCPRCKAAA